MFDRLRRTMPDMLTELDKPTDLRVYTIAQVKQEDYVVAGERGL